MNRLLAPFILALSFGCFGLTTFMPHAPAATLNNGVIAFSRSDGNIYLVDVARKLETKITHFDYSEWSEDMQYASMPSFSPDGNQIAFIQGQMSDELICGSIHVMDIDGRNIRDLNDKATTLLPISWSPDGKSILYGYGCSFTSQIGSIDVETGEITEIHSAGLLAAQYPVWSPDGKRIAYLTWSTDEGDIAIADPTSDAPPLIIDDTFNNFSPSWSPDGREIVFFGGDETSGNLYIVDVETQRIRQLTHDTGLLNTEPRWSPDGKWIAFYSGDYLNGDLQIIDTQGDNRFVVAEHVRNLSWMPQ